MYKINYWCYTAKILAFFDDYEECKKSLEVLQKKYPDAKIWMDKVETISCFNEFMDRTNGLISDYNK